MLRIVVSHPLLFRLLAVMLAALAGVLAGRIDRERQADTATIRLQTETERRAVAIAAETLNGGLMGAVSTLGLIEPAIRAEARGSAVPNNASLLSAFERIGRAHDADGVFIVGGSGNVLSSWDSSGKSSTGVDVHFRPYFTSAMQGRTNVYAAVSLARGDRSLYFTAPVFDEEGSAGRAIGAVVARTDSDRLDALLVQPGGVALLLSPQGVVFAASRPAWIGFLAGTADARQLASIRALKQFGAMFERADPPVLPFALDAATRIDGVRHALARTKVTWNDPNGDWILVQGVDLDAAWDQRRSQLIGLVVGIGVGIPLLLLVAVARSSQRQRDATAALRIHAAAQEVEAQRKARLTAAATRLQQAGGRDGLAHAFLQEAHAMLGVLHGAVYVEDHGRLLLAGAYAAGSGLPAALDLGEGLLGEAARTRRVQLFDSLPSEFGSLRSGLGETRAAAVRIVPLLHGDTLQGVAELATLLPLDEAAARAADELAALLAMNLHISRRLQAAPAPESA